MKQYNADDPYCIIFTTLEDRIKKKKHTYSYIKSTKVLLNNFNFSFSYI